MISADSGAEVIVLSWQLNKESIKKGKRETKREKLRERERETPIGRWKSANPNIDGRSSAVSSDSLAGDFLLGRVEDWQNGRRYLFGGFPFFLLLFLLFPSLSLSLSLFFFFSSPPSLYLYFAVSAAIFALGCVTIDRTLYNGHHFFNKWTLHSFTQHFITFAHWFIQNCYRWCLWQR